MKKTTRNKISIKNVDSEIVREKKITQGIRAFQQRPSAQMFSTESIYSIGAREIHELFSRFTADIIKLDVKFTR
ncbi:MAG: hypothetical protein C5B52_16480 [Bacteroidetes bacterium]|nr:MAG: hypothetical protein C5B52_16480 [Bacteroidota bacterium]